MPLELPNLDDRTYDDLVQEALSLIPTYAPEWTNHNPADPGITLIELFAYLSEMLIYRLNRVTDANQAAFLKLMLGPDAWKAFKQRLQQEKDPTNSTIPDDAIFIQTLLNSKTLNQEIQKVVLQLRQSDRAITSADFETLALRDSQVARAHCLPRRNLDIENPLLPPETYPSHVSVVIIPHRSLVSTPQPALPPQPSQDLIARVKTYLDERRLLTSQIHIVGPRYLKIGIQITLVLKSDALEADVRQAAIAKLRQFFDPLEGGIKGTGWEFGRSVYVSEIYELLDKIPGVDYVTSTVNNAGVIQDEITVSPAHSNRRRLGNQGDLSAIVLHPDELVDAQINDTDIAIVSPIKSLKTARSGGG